MLLDEPTRGLDVLGSQVVIDYVRRLRDEGKAVIVSTHRLDEAERLCDRVGIMMDGKILALERPEDLKARYASGANGRVPTLEETFMAATGYSVEEASAEKE